jgi:serine protease inhibitor
MASQKRVSSHFDPRREQVVKSGAIPAGLNALTHDLLDAMAETKDEFVISPACLYCMIAALAQGTAGQTHDEICALLGGEDAVAESLQALGKGDQESEDSLDVQATQDEQGNGNSRDVSPTDSLDEASSDSQDPDQPKGESGNGAKGEAKAEAKDEAKSFEFFIGSSLWPDSSIPLTPGFEKKAAATGTQVFNLDLHAESTLNAMDEWLCATSGEGTLSSEVSQACFLSVIGALRASGAWKSPFTDTRVKKFHAPDGNYKTEYLTSWEDCVVLERSGSLTVSKHLESGARVILTMPDEGVALKDYVSDGSAWKNMADCFERPKKFGSRQYVRLSVPRVSLESDEIRLIDLLLSMGVVQAFNPLLADFSPMTSNPLSVGMFVQSSKFDLNERGIDGEYLADEGADGQHGMQEDDRARDRDANRKPQKPRKIIFNHPFAFSLITSNGAPLFVGTFSHPAEA